MTAIRITVEGPNGSPETVIAEYVPDITLPSPQAAEVRREQIARALDSTADRVRRAYGIEVTR